MVLPHGPIHPRMINSAPWKAGRRKRDIALIKRVVAGTKEEKTFDTITAQANVDSTQNYTVNLSLVPQGDTASTRDGDDIQAKHIDVTILIDPIHRIITSSTSYSYKYRVMLFKWNLSTVDSNPLTLPSYILEDVSTVARKLMSPYVISRDDKGEFTILYDKVHVFHQSAWVDNQTAASASSFNMSGSKCIRIRKSLRHKLSFVPTLTTGKGHIFLYVLGGDGAANAGVAVQSYARFKYLDN